MPATQKPKQHTNSFSNEDKRLTSTSRRKFVQNSLLYGSGALAIPSYLKGGNRLFSTSNRKVNHVVLCLFAGGIRNFESLEQREGNLMPNTLIGEGPIHSSIASGIDTMPLPCSRPIASQGVLFNKFKYDSPITLHYNAHASILTGRYIQDIELMKPAPHPTLFEMYRKHHALRSNHSNTWWVCDQGGPFPFLRSSSDAQYGQAYAANMIQPSSLANSPLLQHTLPKNDEQLAMELRSQLLGSSLDQPHALSKASWLNLLHDFGKAYHDGIWKEDSVGLNDDMLNIFASCLILERYAPELLVVNMQDSDIGHSNFTSYCNNMHKADYALGKLWSAIQENDKLRSDTVLIVLPEFGRNAGHNSVIDAYGRYAVDHTGDEISKQSFCLIAGPPHIVNQGQTAQMDGEVIDVLPTIAHLLGFEDKIQPLNLPGKVLYEAFV